MLNRLANDENCALPSLAATKARDDAGHSSATLVVLVWLAWRKQGCLMALAAHAEGTVEHHSET